MIAAAALYELTPLKARCLWVWAALLDDDGPTGGFFRDGRPVAW